MWGQLQRATKAVEELDRALAAFPVPDVVGKLFARLDAVHPNGTYDPEALGAFFYTAPASTVQALAVWDQFAAETDDRPELVRQALSHWWFEHIHPVPDGNGRVGRLLVPLALRRKGTLGHACAFLGEAVHLNKGAFEQERLCGRI